ncbi:hypothetical protein ACFLTP_04505 [Chloroflexota bacterium]
MNIHLNELENNTERSAYPPELTDAIYWPFKRLPESRPEACAMACVETALRYSEDARTIYHKVVESWELPGCQALIGDFVRSKQDTRNWQRERARAVVRSEPLPTLPGSWKYVITKAEGNSDFSKLREYAGYLIMIAFNRSKDLESRIPKILPEKSPHLAQAISFCSLLDYLQTKPESNGPRVLSDTELFEFHWFCRTMSSNPTTRVSRQVRRRIVQTLRKKDFTLHNYQTIVDRAEMWYRARVLCNTAREAADYCNIDAID